MSKLVGVLGGLGPKATIDFLAEVLDFTAATTDQEHVDMIVSQRASTPDRTDAILHEGTDPTQQMIKDAKGLETFGADFIVVPCNTASHFMEAVRESVQIPVADIVQLTVQEVVRRSADTKKVGVMATEGTLAAGVYQRALEAHGLEAVLPDARTQKQITNLIYQGVKAGKRVTPGQFFAPIAALRLMGADAVISGCTELSVIYKDLQVTDSDVIDSMDTLAKWTVVAADHQLRANSHT
ncbi:aspartate/glutamate racemase family protein [Boudabousia marimammalium]|uniref:Aspartate racemase n=1 Tax=Boudabousia marimammalium TaxID=156892 RepID=A0A1Q5PS83_9ACTO|nr:amino acid racemase [Boudabousia marimammalium]OKL50416.1 aspartate racemase [Boudabousia marimammalium]